MVPHTGSSMLPVAPEFLVQHARKLGVIETSKRSGTASAKIGLGPKRTIFDAHQVGTMSRLRPAGVKRLARLADAMTLTDPRQRSHAIRRWSGDAAVLATVAEEDEAFLDRWRETARQTERVAELARAVLVL
jgi:hypothetical protein